MKKYELMYILSTQVSDEERNGTIASVEGILTKEGATEVKTEKRGEQKLAYPINKKENGFYVLTTFTIDGTRLQDIERRLNISEDIMKYILVKVEK